MYVKQIENLKKTPPNIDKLNCNENWIFNKIAEVDKRRNEYKQYTYTGQIYAWPLTSNIHP